LPATLAAKLAVEEAVNELVQLGDVPGAFLPGRKLLTVVHAILAGGDFIDDCELLRAEASETVTGHRVRPPPRWARSCGRSCSATSASSTSCSK
jgi:hypothetical protein